MNCPTCGAQNPAEARFCAECGVSLETGAEEAQSVIYCASCGSENPQDAEVCIRCGAWTKGPPAPETPSGGATYYGGPGRTTGILVPRDLGELLSETFRVYRQSFWAFFFIAFLAQLPLLIAQLTPVPGFLFLLPILIIAGIFLNTLGAGAAALAVAWQYLGREISVGACYRRAWNRVLSLLGTSIVYTIALALPFVTIIGIPLSFYLLVRWFFYTQAIMVENKTGPKESLRRSHELVRGSWWRVFGIGITFLIMLLVLSLVAGIPGAIATISSPITGTLLSYIGGVVVTPIAYIGATLVYFDLRVRNEGYTLETMASEVAL